MLMEHAYGTPICACGAVSVHVMVTRCVCSASSAMQGNPASNSVRDHVCEWLGSALALSLAAHRRGERVGPCAGPCAAVREHKPAAGTVPQSIPSRARSRARSVSVIVHRGAKVGRCTGLSTFARCAPAERARTWHGVGVCNVLLPHHRDVTGALGIRHLGHAERLVRWRVCECRLAHL
jgi:hypothetical protein